MRPQHNPYRSQPKVIAIAATRKNVLPALIWHSALAGALYLLCLMLVH